MMKKIIIAIDGYSSTGKSTIAKALANRLNYIYVDTGAMYRAITYYALEKGLIKDNEIDKKTLISELPQIKISFSYNELSQISEVYLNDINIEKQIRTLEVSNYVSQISAISEVRKKLVEQQQNMGKYKGIVMDGRDIGTVVFPEAELKIFMTATTEVRAQRRYEELKNRGDDVSYNQVFGNIVKRDEMDSTRDVSPLVKAKKAIEIDNSNLSLDEQIQKIYELAKKTAKKKV